MSENKDNVIHQKKYGKIDFDFDEKDIVSVWNFQKKKCDVIQIERRNLKKVIEALQTQIKI